MLLENWRRCSYISLMATAHEYFETDFPHAVRLHCHVTMDELTLDVHVLCDFSGFMSFLSVYIPGEGRTLPFYVSLVRHFQYGKSQLSFAHNIRLPNGWDFPGELQINNDKDMTIRARFHGDPHWTSWKDVSMSRRIFIYSDSDLTEDEIALLQAEGQAVGHDIQFRRCFTLRSHPLRV